MIATLLMLAGINVKYEICSWQSGKKKHLMDRPWGGEHIYIYIYILWVCVCVCVRAHIDIYRASIIYASKSMLKSTICFYKYAYIISQL